MKRLQENLYRVNITLTVEDQGGNTETLFLNNIVMCESDLEGLYSMYQNGDNVGFGYKLSQICGQMDMPCSVAGEAPSGPFVFTCFMNTDELTYRYAYTINGEFQSWHDMTISWENIYAEGMKAMPIYSTSSENMRDM